MENKATIAHVGGSMRIGSREYPITAVLQTENGACVPVVNIPQMSDERWHELTRRSRHAG